MPRNVSSARRGYGAAYRRARAELLADNPVCHWCGKPADTADHEPPIEVAGYFHLNLVPACGPCNYARRHRQVKRPYPPRLDW